jgi:hypothetical protein
MLFVPSSILTHNGEKYNASIAIGTRDIATASRSIAYHSGKAAM